jgi:hypothetical protein
MLRAFALPLFLSLALAGAAQSGLREFNADFSLTGLAPVSWAIDSPALVHLGLAATVGLEYDSPLSIPLRFEAGYIRIAASRVSSAGELYRAWEGGRFALLSGYSFAPFSVGKLGSLTIGLLGGGALTAADFTGTALAFAYPSLLLEPRLSLSLRSSRVRGVVQGPSLALPLELMFRAGTHSLAPALSLGWRYRLGVAL